MIIALCDNLVTGLVVMILKQYALFTKNKLKTVLSYLFKYLEFIKNADILGFFFISFIHQLSHIINIPFIL